MAWKKKLAEVPTVVDAPPSTIASAARIDVAAARWPMFRFTDEAWQREAWGFYECNGELSYTADYIGAAHSLVRYYIRHVDENGVPQGEVKDDPEVAALAQVMLGGPAKRGNVLRALGVGVTVAGECYLIGRAARPGFGDEWTSVAAQFVRWYGGKVQVDFGLGQWETLDPARDIIIRIWRQSPQRPLLSQSSARALLLTFSQLQLLRQFLSSELMSRIASGGGLYFLPQELTFPGDADNNIPPGAPGVAQMVYESLSSNIEGQGTAAAIGPTIAEAPIDVIEKMMKEPIRFDVPLSDHAMDYRKELIQDVARGMNVPSDVVEGMRNANHWQSWWATEEFTTKTIAPDCVLFCDAFNTGWLYGALKKLGKDPARYTIWFDLAPLHNSADKFTDTLNLYREEAVDLETLLASANYNMSNAPKDKELNVRRLWKIVERDPSLLQSEGVREFLGLEIEGFVPELATPPPPPPTPDTVPEDRAVGTKPDQSSTVELTDDLSASLVREPPVLSAAHAVVLAALAVAGRRLRTPEFRTLYKDVEPHTLHTKIKVRDLEQAHELLAGAAFSIAEETFNDLGPQGSVDLILNLKTYTAGLLASAIPHSRELLAAFLTGAARR